MVPDHIHEAISIPTHMIITRASIALLILSNAPVSMVSQLFPHAAATMAVTIHDNTSGICGSAPHTNVPITIVTSNTTIGSKASHTFGLLGCLAVFSIMSSPPGNNKSKIISVYIGVRIQ